MSTTPKEEETENQGALGVRTCMVDRRQPVNYFFPRFISPPYLSALLLLTKKKEHAKIRVHTSQFIWSRWQMHDAMISQFTRGNKTKIKVAYLPPESGH